MPYATQSDIAELYGQAALYVADHDRDGAIDDLAVERALTSASDEIDSYVGVRYPLPLAVVPGILRQHCVDIAVYRLALSADVLSTEHRTRYEDALAALRRIADGKGVLVFPVDPEAPPADDGAPADGLPAGPQPMVVAGPPRLFSREQMRDF